MPQSSLTHLTPTEIFQKTRRIEIRTSRLVNELFGGQYHSSFKGRGVEFVDVREYVPGDDVRSIHWNITARLDTPYVKRFTEERELTILIAVDVSGSQSFGTRGRFKAELAAELVSLIAFAALKNNDKIGLILFSDRIETYIPPRKTRSHVLRLVRDVLGFEPQSPKTDIAGALQYLNRVQKKKAIVFLISDFIDKGFEKGLAITHRRHDTVAFVLEDKMEREWPSVKRLLIEDAETGRRTFVDGGRLFKNNYNGAAQSQANARNAAFARLNLDHVVLRTHEDYIRPILRFFEQRARKNR